MPTVLVTGANRGLGLEFARQYAADGWQVLAGVREPDSADELHALARDSSRQMRILRMNVTDSESIRAAARDAGDAAIDVLINCAGVMGGKRQTAGNMDYASWAEVLDINTMGPLRVTEAFVDQVARSDTKLIATITSGMGSIADNTSGGYIAYRTSKTAVNMVMRSLALDLQSRKVSCIVINPGWVRTRMGGASAPLRPEDSIRAMRKVFENVTLAQSGKFFNHDGREYPW